MSKIFVTKVLTCQILALCLVVGICSPARSEQQPVKVDPVEANLFNDPKINDDSLEQIISQNVSELGEFITSVALALPRGPNGFGPSLSLVYDERANSNLGAGWSLAGISTITRCTAGKAQHGVRETISFALDAPLCLDGRLLVRKSTSNVAFDEFSAENDQLERIRGFKNMGYYDHFEVTNAQGVVHVFGQTDASRVFSTVGVPFVWHEDLATDVFGNGWAIIYDKNVSDNEIVVKRISYGRNVPSHTADSVIVSFTYSNKSVSDIRRVGASVLVTKRLLTSVEIDVSGAIRSRQYQLAYTKSPSTGRDLLAELRSCEKPSGECANPIKFTWDSTLPTSAKTNAWVFSGTITKTDQCQELYALPLDSNLPSMVCVVKAGDIASAIHVAKPLGDGNYSEFKQIRAFDASEGCATLLPYTTTANGSVAYICLGQSQDQMKILNTVAGGFNNRLTIRLRDEVENPFSDKCEWSLSDVDGDGYNDLICAGFNEDSDRKRIYTGQVTYWLLNGDTGGISAPHDVFVARPPDSDTCKLVETDVNGDGVADIVCVAIGTGTGWALLSDGNGYEGFHGAFASMSEGCQPSSAEANGDNQSELVCELKVGPNFTASDLVWSPSGFTPGSSRVIGTAEAPCAAPVEADLNGDGKADVACAGAHTGSINFWAVTSGSSLSSPPMIASMPSSSDEDCVILQAGDFYGNSNIGLGCITFSSAQSSRFITVGTPFRPDRIVNVATSPSRSISVEYKPVASCSLSQQDALARNRTPDNSFKVTANISVVCTLTEAFGPDLDKISYTYSDLFLLAGGRGLAPFVVRTESNERRGEFTIYEQATAHPIKGMIIGETRYRVSGPTLRKFQETKTNYAFFRFDPNWTASDDEDQVIVLAENNLFFREQAATQAAGSASVLVPVRVARTNNEDLLPPKPDCSLRAPGEIICGGFPESDIVQPIPFDTLPSPDRRGVSYFVYVANQTLDMYDESGGIITASNTHQTYDKYGCLRKIAKANGRYQGDTIISYKNALSQWRRCQLLGQTVHASGPFFDRKKLSTFLLDDATGAVVSETSGDGPDQSVTTYSYDLFGNILKSEQMTRSGEQTLRNVRNSEYDSSGRLKVRAWDDRGSDIAYQRDPFSGDILSEKSGNLQRSEVFRSFSRLLNTTDEFGRSTSVYAGGCTPSLCGSGGYTYREIVADTGSRELVIFDYRGKEVRRLEAGPNGALLVSEHKYDRRSGQVSSSVGPVSIGTIATPSTWTYDVLDRFDSMHDPRGLVRTFLYKGLTQQESINGVTKRTVRLDEMGRQERVENTGSVPVTYRYDSDGTVLGAVASTVQLFNREYDEASNTAKVTSASTEPVTYQYDSVGRIIAEKRQSGETIHYKYDSHGYLIERKEPEGVTTWLYGPGPFGGRRLLKIFAPRFFEESRYDEAGRLKSRTQTISGESHTLTYSYGALGRLKGVKLDGSDLGFEYSYNRYGAAVSVKNISGEQLASVNGYGALGQIASMGFGNGLITNIDVRANDGQMASVNITDCGRSLFEERYQYDTDGMLLSARSSGEDNWRYHYDDLLRVTGYEHQLERRSFAVSFEYDQLGRPTVGPDGQKLTYEPNVTDRIVSARANSKLWRYSYDTRGRETYDGDNRIAYSSFDKMTTVSNQDGIQRIAYGPGHETIEVAFTSSAARTTGLGLTERPSIVRRFFGFVESSRWSWTQRVSMTVPFAGGVVAVLIKDSIGSDRFGRTRFLNFDRNGSLRIVSDENGRVVARYRYSYGGKQDLITGAGDGSGVGVLRQIGFLGKSPNFEGRLLDFGPRVLNTNTGSFLSPDLVIVGQNDGSLTQMYGFAANDPINRGDSTGLFLDGIFNPIGTFFGNAWNAIKKAGEDTWRWVTSPTGRLVVAIIVAVAVTVLTDGAGAGFSASVLSGMAAGAASAAVYTALGGGNFGQVMNAAAMGAIVGGIAGAASFGVNWVAGTAGRAATEAGWSQLASSAATYSIRVVGRALGTAVVARAFGGTGGFWTGDFASAFKSGAVMYGIAELGQAFYQYYSESVYDGQHLEGEQPRAFLDPATQPASTKLGDNNYGVALDDNSYGCRECNNFGNAEGIGFLEEGGPASTVAAKIPGFNSWAYLHDSMMEGQTSWGMFTLTATIIPAGIINWTALSADLWDIQRQAEMSCAYRNAEAGKC